MWWPLAVPRRGGFSASAPNCRPPTHLVAYLYSVSSLEGPAERRLRREPGSFCPSYPPPLPGEGDRRLLVSRPGGEASLAVPRRGGFLASAPNCRPPTHLVAYLYSVSSLVGPAERRLRREPGSFCPSYLPPLPGEGAGGGAVPSFLLSSPFFILPLLFVRYWQTLRLTAWLSRLLSPLCPLPSTLRAWHRSARSAPPPAPGSGPSPPAGTPSLRSPSAPEACG